MSFADLKAMIFGRWTKREPADVAKILDEMADKAHENFDWRHSIVDLLKLLGLSSDLNARQRLAREFGYDVYAHDMAEMNIWLHKTIMQKLAENGGKVPDELR